MCNLENNQFDPTLTTQLHQELDKILANNRKPYPKVESIDPTREDKRRWRENVVKFPRSFMYEY